MPELLDILPAHLPDELRQPRIELTLSGLQVVDIHDVQNPTQTRYEIFHYERNGEMIGGAFSMMRPDGTLLTLQPAVVPTEPETTLRFIYKKLLDYAVAEHARLVMLLVDFQQSADATLLDEYGFDKVSELLNLNAERAIFPTDCPAYRLAFRPYKNELWDEMVALVEKTYKNTLDFPRLTGLVPADNILRGYQESHVFDPTLWFFIEFHSQIIGALLLSQIDNSDHLELTYVGLMETFRGQGFFREIVKFSQFVANERNSSHLLVSVDSANFPALNTYIRYGFQIHDQKEIFVRFL